MQTYEVLFGADPDLLVRLPKWREYWMLYHIKDSEFFAYLRE